MRQRHSNLPLQQGGARTPPSAVARKNLAALWQGACSVQRNQTCRSYQGRHAHNKGWRTPRTLMSMRRAQGAPAGRQRPIQEAWSPGSCGAVGMSSSSSSPRASSRRSSCKRRWVHGRLGQHGAARHGAAQQVSSNGNCA